MADFPLSTEELGWFNEVLVIFNAFDTHIIGDDFSLGAMWTNEAQMTQANYERPRALDVNIDAAASIEAEFIRTKGVSGEYESEEETELRLAFYA